MQPNNKCLCSGLEPYLSEEATIIVDTLVKAGLDKDIAFEMVAADESAFDLPSSEELSALSLESRCERK